MHEIYVGNTLVYFDFVDGDGDLPEGVVASLDPDEETKTFIPGHSAYAIYGAVNEVLRQETTKQRTLKERERAIEDVNIMFGNSTDLFKPTRTGIFSWFFGG